MLTALVAAATNLVSYRRGQDSVQNKINEVAQKATEYVFGKLTETIDRMEREIAHAKEMNAKCEEGHAHCKAELDALWLRVNSQPIPAYQLDRPRGGAPGDE